MIGAGDAKRPPAKPGRRAEFSKEILPVSSTVEDLRSRTQQLSLREQLERNHFLLKRLYASSARLMQSLVADDAYEAIAEIIANLIGSEEVAIFRYSPDGKVFSLQWSWGVDPYILEPCASGAGMLGRAVHSGKSQFRERQDHTLLLPHEKNLTACIVVKSSQEVVGAIAIFSLLPQKSCLEWADFELLKFLEIYAAAALQFHWLQRKLVSP